ncbi:MAG: hypothetical protein FWC06_01635 [Treponema sp.]|nr:hypothetical protein [Treponema sp.]
MSRKQSITLFFLLILHVLPHAELSAQSIPSSPRIAPDPKALEYYNLGRLNNGYSWTDLAQISLWASGAADGSSSYSSAVSRITAAAAAVNNSNDLPASDRERAEYIFSYMHTNILRTYSYYQTRIDTIFTNGSYNCVSSAVLYMILCGAAGINTSGVITREHAFVTVHIDGQDIDVETTNRYGFDPGNRREFHDQFGRVTGFTYVTAQNYRDRQTISNIEMISLILNNRIADFERRGNFINAVPLAIDKATLLLGDTFTVSADAASVEHLFTDPRKDLTDRLLNYAGTFLRSNREEDGIIWALSVSSMYPSQDRWDTFLQAAVNNRITRFLRETKITEARNFLNNNKTHITEEEYAGFDTVIIETDLTNRAGRINSKAAGDSVINDTEQARKENRLSENRANELIIFAVLKTAAAVSAAPLRDWRGAIGYIENAVARFGTSRELEQSLNTYRNNLAADYHNRFASEWNKRNYEEAQLILNEGLKEFPNNRQLQSDKEIVNRHISR